MRLVVAAIVRLALAVPTVLLDGRRDRVSASVVAARVEWHSNWCGAPSDTSISFAAMLSVLRTGTGSRSGGGSPAFLLRPDQHEGRLLAAHADEVGAVVLLGRHLAPYPEGSSEQAQGLRGDEFAQTVRAAGVEWVLDPDTAVLPYMTGDGLDAAFGRAALMRCAQGLTLPLASEDLERDADLREMLVALLAGESRAAVPTAAYFRFRSLADPWLSVNLRAARMTQSLTRGGPVGVFIQTDVDALRDGVLAKAAPLYADVLEPRGLVFFQIAGLDAERADREDLAAYLRAVGVWRAHGFSVIADRVGRFGLAAVAAGASGMACGTRFYRSVPDLELEQHVRSPSVRYWAPNRGDRLGIDDARNRVRRGSLPPCPVQDCGALLVGATIEDVRLHNIHLAGAELDLASTDAARLAKQLGSSPIAYVRVWGEVLQDALRLSAHA